MSYYFHTIEYYFSYYHTIEHFGVICFPLKTLSYEWAYLVAKYYHEI